MPHANKVLLKVARILIYIDGLLSVAPNCAQAVAIFLLPYSRTFKLVKRLAGSPKELKLIPTCPTLTKCYSKVAHAFLYTLMDFFQSHQCPSRCYLTFFHIPERSIALVKRLAGSPKGLKLIPTCPTLTKCYSKVAHILIYIDGLLSVAQTVPKPLLSYLLPYSRTFNCTSKTTGWFTKRG
jgi:hypothetical protein